MPREGHLAGCQVSPLREGAPQVSPQARALGESTLGWAGHAQLKCPRPARLPPPTFSSLWHWRRRVGRGSMEGLSRRGGGYSKRGARPLPRPHAHAHLRPRLSSAQVCPPLQCLGPRCRPAELGGSPQGGGGPALAHTCAGRGERLHQLWGSPPGGMGGSSLLVMEGLGGTQRLLGGAWPCRPAPGPTVGRVGGGRDDGTAWWLPFSSKLQGRAGLCPVGSCRVRACTDTHAPIRLRAPRRPRTRWRASLHRLLPSGSAFLPKAPSGPLPPHPSCLPARPWCPGILHTFSSRCSIAGGCGVAAVASGRQMGQAGVWRGQGAMPCEAS